MKRGDVVTIALNGDYGKPRPAVIIQGTLFADHPSFTLLPMTSDIRETPLFRMTILPSIENGLRAVSQVMIDKAQTVSIDRLGPVIGSLLDSEMLAISRALSVFLGIA